MVQLDVEKRGQEGHAQELRPESTSPLSHFDRSAVRQSMIDVSTRRWNRSLVALLCLGSAKRHVD